MSEMMSITIGFSTAKNKNSLIAAAVRTAERTAYSHVYMKFHSKSIERWLVYHASHTNIHFNNIETFNSQNRVLEEYTLHADSEDYKKALQLCVDRVGLPYGGLQLVGMGYARLMKAWFDKKVKNPFADGQSTQVCSEIAGRLLAILEAPIDVSLLEYEGPKYIHSVVMKMVENGTAVRVV